MLSDTVKVGQEGSAVLTEGCTKKSEVVLDLADVSIFILYLAGLLTAGARMTGTLNLSPFLRRASPKRTARAPIKSRQPRRRERRLVPSAYRRRRAELREIMSRLLLPRGSRLIRRNYMLSVMLMG